MDPITKEIDKKPFKTFMVNQLQIAFERDMMILSPFDDVLSKQLIDYEVERIGANGNPVFTSENEHFVDALGLAYLAMVLEFKELTGVIEEPENTSMFLISNKQIGGMSAKIESEMRTNNDQRIVDYYQNTDFSDLPGDRPTMVKVDMGYRSNKYASQSNWGSRMPKNNFSRSLFGRGGFGR